MQTSSEWGSPPAAVTVRPAVDASGRLHLVHVFGAESCWASLSRLALGGLSGLGVSGLCAMTSGFDPFLMVEKECSMSRSQKKSAIFFFLIARQNQPLG